MIANKWVKITLIVVAVLLAAFVIVSGLYAFGAIKTTAKVTAPVTDNRSSEQTEDSAAFSDGLNCAVVAPENHSFNPIITVNVYNLTITVKPTEALVKFLRDNDRGQYLPDIEVGYMSFGTGRTQGSGATFQTLDEFAQGATIKIFDMRYLDYSDLGDVRFFARISFGSLPVDSVNTFYSETPRYNLASYTVQDFENAYNKGEQDGFYDGYGKGNADGYDKGQAEGNAKGYENGYSTRDGEAKAYLGAMTLKDYLSVNGTATILFLSSLAALLLYVSGLVITFAVLHYRG